MATLLKTLFHFSPSVIDLDGFVNVLLCYVDEFSKPQNQTEEWVTKRIHDWGLFLPLESIPPITHILLRFKDKPAVVFRLLAMLILSIHLYRIDSTCTVDLQWTNRFFSSILKAHANLFDDGDCRPNMDWNLRKLFFRSCIDVNMDKDLLMISHGVKLGQMDKKFMEIYEKLDKNNALKFHYLIQLSHSCSENGQLAQLILGFI